MCVHFAELFYETDFSHCRAMISCRSLTQSVELSLVFKPVCTSRHHPCFALLCFQMCQGLVTEINRSVSANRGCGDKTIPQECSLTCEFSHDLLHGSSPGVGVSVCAVRSNQVVRQINGCFNTNSTSLLQGDKQFDACAFSKIMINIKVSDICIDKTILESEVPSSILSQSPQIKRYKLNVRNI